MLIYRPNVPTRQESKTHGHEYETINLKVVFRTFEAGIRNLRKIENVSGFKRKVSMIRNVKQRTINDFIHLKCLEVPIFFLQNLLFILDF